MKKVIFKGFLAGFIESIVLDSSIALLFFLHSVNLTSILIGLVSAGIFMAIYLFLSRDNVTNKEIVIYTLVSSFGFALSYTIMLAIRISLPVDFDVVREDSNADSIILFLSSICFICLSFFLKLCNLIYFLIRQARQ